LPQWQDDGLGWMVEERVVEERGEWQIEVE
jgi:hypothetical protein